MDLPHALAKHIYAYHNMFRPCPSSQGRVVLTPEQIQLARAWLVVWLVNRQDIPRELAHVITDQWTAYEMRAFQRARRFYYEIRHDGRFNGPGF